MPAIQSNAKRGLKSIAREQWLKKIDRLATIPHGLRLVSHPVVDGKIQGVPVETIIDRARSLRNAFTFDGERLHITRHRN
jgi:hypothetical protein